MALVPQRRQDILRMAGGALVLLALVWQGWLAYERRATAGRLDASGTIEATEVEVSSKIPGRVIRMLVKEGDQVQAGQVLAEMDPQEARAQVDQARAQLTAAEARVPQAEATVTWQERTVRESIASTRAQLSAAQAALASARSTLTKARNDLTRAKELFAQGAAATQQVDQAQAAYDAAVAQDHSAEDAVAQAQAALAAAEANQMQVRIRQHELAAARAALAQASATLRYTEVLAAHNTITAPSDGVVLTKNIEPGEVVAAATPIYTLINLQDMWLRVFIPENKLGYVRVGQRAQITVDTFPHRTFAGRITEISSQAEFTPGNVQTKEDRVKLVFGVKIRVDNRDGSLKPGMPADAEILVGTEEEQDAR